MINKTELKWMTDDRLHERSISMLKWSKISSNWMKNAISGKKSTLSDNIRQSILFLIYNKWLTLHFYFNKPLILCFYERKALDLIEYTRRTLLIEQNHYKAPYKTRKECLFSALKKGIPYLLKTTKNSIIKVQLQGTSNKTWPVKRQQRSSFFLWRNLANFRTHFHGQITTFHTFFLQNYTPTLMKKRLSQSPKILENKGKT